jgi:aminopeptidase-like protein
MTQMNERKLSKIFDDLFPILSSITGPGYKKSILKLSKYIDLFDDRVNKFCLDNRKIIKYKI